MQVSFIHIRSQRQNTAETGLNNLETHHTSSYSLHTVLFQVLIQVLYKWAEIVGFILQGLSPLLVVMIFFLEYTLNGSSAETTVFYD